MVLGRLSSSILDGILSSLSEAAGKFEPPNSSKNALTEPRGFTCCVHKEESATSLRKKYEQKIVVTVVARDNVRAVKQSDVVILGVEPSVYREVISEPGMKEALTGKILVTIVGGLSISALENAIYGEGPFTDEERQHHCDIVRVVPNTATAVREGITLIIEEQNSYRDEILNPVYSLFLRTGAVKMWPAAKTPIGATLAASSPAFFSIFLEAIVDGATSEGIDQEDAIELATAAMRGYAGLIAGGQTASQVRRKIATPGGSTEAGMTVMWESSLRDIMKNALKAAALKAAGLGNQKPEK